MRDFLPAQVLAAGAALALGVAVAVIVWQPHGFTPAWRVATAWVLLAAIAAALSRSELRRVRRARLEARHERRALSAWESNQEGDA